MAVTESSCNTDIIKWSLVVIINIRPKFNPKSCVLLDLLFVMYPGHIQKVLRRMRTSGQWENVLRIFSHVGGICDACLADCCQLICKQTQYWQATEPATQPMLELRSGCMTEVRMRSCKLMSVMRYRYNYKNSQQCSPTRSSEHAGRRRRQ